ncbi:MAG: hypothetical protein IJW45_01555 [Oscillospiraceae bacterium]|nr:hypothetical protein [Oscillospiraceae bacterium]
MRLGLLLFRGLIRRHLLRAVLIGLCAMFCFTGALGVSWAGESLVSTRQDLEDSWGEADLVVYTQHQTPGDLEEAFLGIEGVDAVSEGMLAEPIRCRFQDGQVRSVRLFALLDHQLIRPVVQGDGELALSYGYKVDAGVDGSLVLALPQGETVSVRATAAMPMYTGVYVDRAIVSTDGDMVDIYAPVERVTEIVGECYVNYALVRLDGSVPVEQVRDRIAGSEDVFVSYVAEREPAYEASLALEDVICRICALFPWIMLGVGLLFVSIFLAGAAGQCRGSIGVLRTDGAPLGAIYLGICLFALVSTLAGACLAVPAAWALAKTILEISLENMGLPGGTLVLSWPWLIRCLGGCLGACVVATGVGMLTVSGGRVARIRRRRGGRVRGRCAAVVATAVSTGAAVCMSLMSMMFMDSLDAVRQEQFSDRYGFHVQVVYEDLVPLSRLQELREGDMVQRCEPMLFGTMSLSAGDREWEVSCVALSDDPLLILRDEAGQPLPVVEDGICLSADTAARLGVGTGDLIRARIRYGSTQIRVMCSVTGVSAQSTAFLEAVSLETVEAYLDSSGVMNSVAVTVRPGCLEDFRAYVQTLPGVLAVQTGEAGQRRFDCGFSGTRVLVTTVILASIALGTSVCLMMCYAQWKRELRRDTVEHLLGRSAWWLAFRSALWRLPGVALGLAAGSFAALELMPGMLRYLSTDTIAYPRVADPGTLLTGGGLCLLAEGLCFGMYLLADLRQWRRPRG